MPDDPPSDTPPPDGMHGLSDQLMTFTSPEDSTIKQPVKKAAMKAAKDKLKARKSTPAPPPKGNGRKRFVPSPIPEDKQPWKKLDFGKYEEIAVKSPKCKNELFPTPPSQVKGDESHVELEHNEAAKEHEMERPLADVETPNGGVVSFSDQNSGQVVGDAMVDDKGVSPKVRQDKNVVLGAAKGNDALREERVNLPEMGMGTKMLLESCLVPY